MSKGISKDQIKALRTAASKLWGQCDCSEAWTCQYHNWLAENFDGIASTKDLTQTQATLGISFLRKQINYQPKRSTYTGQGKRGRAAGRITPEQAQKIGALAQQLDWDDSAVRNFINRQTGQTMAVEWLREYQATKVIIGMQKILAHGDKQTYQELNTRR